MSQHFFSRQTDRQTDRQTERDRETEAERQTDRQTDRETDFKGQLTTSLPLDRARGNYLISLIKS